MSYTQTFRASCEPVTHWRPLAADSGRGTLTDPEWTQAGTFQARVKERTAGEILLPTGNMDGLAAEVICDESSAAGIAAGDILTAADRAWRVAGIEYRRGPHPRAVVKCALEQRKPQGVS